MTNPAHTTGSLNGVRILDMATVLAAPFGATLCADHGADVVKLELPDGSDPLRSLQPVKEGKALWWKVANRGKRGITLDVRKPEGRDIFLKMLPEFDVLVENFRTGTMDKWGLDAQTLFSVNPKLVIMRLTGFGQTGPYRARPGFARIFEAMSGFTNLNGEEGGAPMHTNFPVGDAVAGVFAAFSIASEMVRIRSDADARGVEIDLSASEALFRLLDPLAIEYEQLDVVRKPAGNRATYTAPSNMYCSADGIYFSLVASSNPIFARLCVVLGRPEWMQDPRFRTNIDRVANMEALDSAIRQYFLEQRYDAIAGALEAQGIPFSKIYTIEDINQDVHFQARQTIIRLPDPDYGTVPAPCIVPRIVGQTMQTPRTGPDVGEHNDEVYGELGLDADVLAQLRDNNII